jgi:hypothetical protein
VSNNTRAILFWWLIWFGVLVLIIWGYSISALRWPIFIFSIALFIFSISGIVLQSKKVDWFGERSMRWCIRKLGGNLREYSWYYPIKGEKIDEY